MAEILNIEKDVFGQAGFDLMTSGTETDGGSNQRWYAIQAVGDATAQVDVTNEIGDSLTNLVLSKGQTIYVTASEITVDNGSILAYRNEID